MSFDGRPTSALLGFLLCHSVCLGQSFSVSAPVVIDSFGFNHPQIELTDDGLPGVLWSSGSSYNLYFAKYDGAGAFLPPVQLNPPGFDVQTYNWSGPDIAVEGMNVFVAFKQLGYTTGHLYLVKSTDNGATFGDTVRIDQLASGFGQYPDIAVYNDTIFVTFMSHDAAGMDPQYVVARSVDGGVSFEPEVPVGALLGHEACDCCPPEIIVNSSHVVVYFRDNDTDVRDIKAIFSSDRGATFADWFDPDSHTWNINSCPSTGPDARFINGTDAISVYRSEFDDSARIFVNMFDVFGFFDEGMTEIRSSTGNHLQPNYPQIAVEGGDAVIVWEEGETGLDVFINASATGPAGFLASNSMNITLATGTQGKPDIAMKDGLIHVVYADNAAMNLKYVQIVSPLVSTKESLVKPYQIWPNPATDVLYIGNVSAEFNYTVFDLLGRKVASGQWHNQDEGIAVGGLSPGNYLIQLQDNFSQPTGQCRFSVL